MVYTLLTENTVILLGAIVLGIQWVYWLILGYGFRRVQTQPIPSKIDICETAMPALSVVVAAHNEATQLPQLLHALAGQTHPTYEVIIVDDHSTDHTPALVQAYDINPHALRLVQLSDVKKRGKKTALVAGIQVAQHNILAFTDADCEPKPAWLSTVAQYHQATQPCVLVGYGPIRSAGTWLNRFVRYETLTTAFLTSAAIGLNRPYMAVGRNLSYSRRLFERVKGFGENQHLLSGDDDLFVQAIHQMKAGTIRYMLHPDTFVYTDAPTSWKQWVQQKRRHTSASRAYNRQIQFHLALFHGSNLLCWLAPALFGWMGWGIWAGKLAVQGWVLNRGANAFRERGLMPFFPLLEGCYVLYNTFIAPIGVLFPPKRWK